MKQYISFASHLKHNFKPTPRMPPSPNPTPSQIWSILRSSPSSPLPLETLLTRSIPSPSPSLIASVLASSADPSEQLLSLRLFVWSALRPRSPLPSLSSSSLASSLLRVPSDPLLLHRLLDSPSFPVTSKTFSVLLRLSPNFPLSLSLLRRMPQFSLRPDLPIFNSLLRLSPSPSASAQLFQELSLPPFCLRPDLSTFSLLLSSFSSARLLSPARSLLPLMRSHSLPPSLPAYTSVLSCACTRGDLLAAREILHEMRSNSVPPNVVTYTRFIKCLCDKGSLDEAVAVLDAMEKEGCRPNRVTLRTLIAGFCHAGKLDQAYTFVERVGGGEECYSLLVSCLLRAGYRKAAEGLLGRMLEMGVRPDGWACNSFMRELCEKRMFLEAYRWVGELEEKGSCVDSDVYSSLLEGLCQEGCSAEALELARRVVEREIPVENSCADALVALLQGIDSEGDLASQILRRKAEEESFPSHT